MSLVYTTTIAPVVGLKLGCRNSSGLHSKQNWLFVFSDPGQWVCKADPISWLQRTANRSEKMQMGPNADVIDKRVFMAEHSCVGQRWPRQHSICWTALSVLLEAVASLFVHGSGRPGSHGGSAGQPAILISECWVQVSLPAHRMATHVTRQMW